MLAGEFHERVSAEESVWNLEDKTKVLRRATNCKSKRTKTF